MATPTAQTPEVPLEMLAKLITPDKLHELAILVKKEHPDVLELPIERVNEFIARMCLPTPEVSADLISKRTPITGVPDAELIQVVVGDRPFHVPKDLLMTKDSVFSLSSRRVFPDRNPRAFKFILKLLRGDTSFISSLNAESMSNLKGAIAYYGFFDLLTKPIIQTKPGNLAAMSPSFATSSISSNTKFLTNTDTNTFDANSGSDCSNPWWELNFKSKKVVVTSASLGVRDKEGSEGPYNVFDVSLLAGITEVTPTGDLPGEPYVGEIPTDSSSVTGIKAWRVIGTASSTENKTRALNFALSSCPMMTSVLRVQFKRHRSLGLPVKLRVYNIIVNGVGLVTL